MAYAPPWLAVDTAPNTNKKRSHRPRTQTAEPKVKRSAPSLPYWQKRQSEELIGYPDRKLLAPPYQIHNENTYDDYGGLSNNMLDIDIVHYDGHVELDVHNIYGSMMSSYSRNAMLARRPNRRPMVITRSTFAGAGRDVGKWLGDNLSLWEHYRSSIQGMLNFASLFQMSMVSSDICGFGGNTTETLCARWATLGAFYPFMRNHNGDSSIPQEFFVWPTVAEAARNALDIRYRLLDYLYTHMHRHSETGAPVLNPHWFLYTDDEKTFGNQLQFFYGDSILVSPVTDENKTTVSIYLPDDRFYDFYEYSVFEGEGVQIDLTDIAYTDIPLHIRGGSIIPMRNQSAYTTTEVRKQPFHLLIAPDREGKASGSLYLDDGDSVKQATTSEIEFEYESGELSVTGSFGYTAGGDKISAITVLGRESEAFAAKWKRDTQGWQSLGARDVSYDAEKGTVTVRIDHALDQGLDMSL